MSTTQSSSQYSLENYTFLKTIGEGTFGKVKLALHKITQEKVAIKILEKKKINSKKDLERIEKEIKYMKILNHPNIVKIYEIIEDENNFYISMEYVPGGELFNYIVKNKRLTENESSFFYSQIIHIIKEIHKHKICHRDLKPENLLLTHNKTIKIIDFGLSNEYEDYLITPCGSPCYASPEVIKGMKYSGLGIDLWASGIVLFSMLCGYLPFDDKNNDILFQKILKCHIEFPKKSNVIISENAELSLNTDGSDSKAEIAYKKGVAHILAKDDEQALEYARKLVSTLPSNNLSGACVAYESVDAQAQTDISMTASQAAAAVCDADSAVELQAAYGEGAKTIISTINGNTVGVIALDSKTLNGKACSKAARFIRFCDAFSLPVISFVDAEKFECIKCAAKLTSAYAEATTAKITVITGDAFGSVYIAAAGTGAAADITLAWPDAYVSALSPEAAAVIMLGDDFGRKLKGSKDPKNDRAAVVAQFKDENLTAFSAAGNGYIDDIINAEETREKLITAIDMLSNKRISTLPKKHNNLYI